MRWIEKPDQEYSLIAEFREASREAPETFRYDNFRKKKELAKLLTEEQGGLCAYTMRSILSNTSGEVNAHLEHIVPQSQCEQEGAPERALDHRNILACFPAPNQRSACSFGTEYKADTRILLNQNLVSPLQQDCETRFVYQFDGTVEASVTDVAVQETIRILNLNEVNPKSGFPGELARLRRATIEGFGLSPLAPDPLQGDELDTLMLTLTETAGSPPEYVTALRQCLQRFRLYLQPDPSDSRDQD